MGINDIAQVQEADIKAQAHLWNIVYGFADTLVLRCAIELGIADIIHSNNDSVTISHIASKLPVDNVDIDNLYRILRYLVHLGLLKESENKCYSLEHAATLLLKDAQRSMVPSILGMTEKDFVFPWYFMKEGLGRGSVTPFEKGTGMTLWKYLEGNLDHSQKFNEGMAGDTRILTSALVNGCPDTFQGLTSLVDVGGGNGTLIKGIHDAFPHIKCSLYDLPHVIASGHPHPNIERIPGDMFKSVPSAQAILLKLILHDWTDEECVDILKRCIEAIPKEGGKVIIVDVVLEENGSQDKLTKTRLLFDIDMYVCTGGRERSVSDWDRVLKLAGFSSHKIRHIPAIQCVIEAFP